MQIGLNFESLINLKANTINEGIRTRKGTAVSENAQWAFEQAVVQGDRKGSRRTEDAQSVALKSL